MCGRREYKKAYFWGGRMSKEKRFVIQVDPLEIEDDAIFDNKESRLYECQSDMMSDICSLLNKQDQRIADLEAKLAEFEKFMKGNKFNDIQDVQNAINGIFQDIFDEKHKVWISICDRFAKCEQENKQLKQQLAEKEEEFKEYRFKERNIFGMIEKIHQDKIELLENLKDYLNEMACVPKYNSIHELINRIDLIEYIDTLIKEIKGE